MRAVLLSEHGDLSFEEVPDPIPAEGEVVVEVIAAGVNRRDLLLRNPPSSAYRFDRRFVMGTDGAGVCQDSGDEVILFPPLDWGPGELPEPSWRLLGGPADGTYAERVKVPLANVFAKPPELSWEEAAALPVAGLTAYRALFGVGELKAGQTVLVLGAGSGLSTIAVQLAAAAGARVVVTSSNEAKLTKAAAIGAHDGVLYSDAGWTGKLPPIDLAFDSVGTTWPAALESLRPGGRLVTVGATGGAAVAIDVRSVYLRSLSIRGSTLGSPSDFAGLLAFVRHAGIKPVIDSTWGLADAGRAHDRMAAAEHFGKLILTPEQ